MGWFSTKIERVKAQGTIPIVMWVTAKFFLGLGIAFLIAGTFPGQGWLMWGLIFIILGIIFAFPLAKAVLFKKY
ncbi:MAG: hypothetical protein JSW41_04555 [Candidatus Aenigmatarchaeota archaeon]|nr:MAG: hypothetical protein JSW41_04555 [Candidatus Aenigmarchaeota archaeon]